MREKPFSKDEIDMQIKEMMENRAERDFALLQKQTLFGPQGTNRGPQGPTGPTGPWRTTGLQQSTSEESGNIGLTKPR